MSDPMNNMSQPQLSAAGSTHRLPKPVTRLAYSGAAAGLVLLAACNQTGDGYESHRSDEQAIATETTQQPNAYGHVPPAAPAPADLSTSAPARPQNQPVAVADGSVANQVPASYGPPPVGESTTTGKAGYDYDDARRNAAKYKAAEQASKDQALARAEAERNRLQASHAARDKKERGARQKLAQVGPKYDYNSGRRPAPRPSAPSHYTGHENYADFEMPPVLTNHNVPAMFFQHYGVNPTIETAHDRYSTFSMDVDTASWRVSKAFLERGQLPDPAAVRVEEFVNAFDYQYATPHSNTFSLNAEAFPSPHRPGYHVLHLGVKTKELTADARKPANLTFVIDVSGSMKQSGRLTMVKDSLGMLVNQLDGDDQIAIVAYNQRAKVILDPTRANNKRQILAAIRNLAAGGNTNVEDGLEEGYELAEDMYERGLVNRVILLSDGVANVGKTDAQDILKAVRSRAAKGITLTSVGVGMGNYNDVLLEQLADKGDGNYTYVDNHQQAEKFFVQQLGANLQVAAKDAKIQVEFNPQHVLRYRLLGYENRAVADRDFLNGKVDAGEVGAGHSVTAIYEVKFTHGRPHGEFGRFRVSYKHPQGQRVRMLDKPLPPSIVRNSWQAASAPSRIALVAASFAEKLRGSYWARAYSYGQLGQLFDGLSGRTAWSGDAQTLRQLIATAERLDQRADGYQQYGSVATMSFDSVPILR